jgi:hypothetical protein
LPGRPAQVFIAAKINNKHRARRARSGFLLVVAMKQLLLPLLVLLFSAGAVSAVLPSCVLKVRIDAPANWYSATPVGLGFTNVNVNATVRNLSSGLAPVGIPTMVMVLDNGSAFALGSNGSGYIGSYRETRKGLHSYGVKASLPAAGCIDDSQVQYYYYNESSVQGIPDFNPLLLPLVGLLAVFFSRQAKAR